MSSILDPLIVLLQPVISLSWAELVLIALQLAFLGVVLIVVYRHIRGSQVEKILNGILIIALFIFIFYTLNLNILTKIFELLLPAILVGLVVLFAPEMRRFLHRLGRDGFSWAGLIHWMRSPSVDFDQDITVAKVTDEIIEAVKVLSRNKNGAILVFDNTWSDRLYLSSGRKVNATVSTELLLNIFYPKSPLHDGAVIIRNLRIYAASVILPITENPRLNPWQYGTRHRAALGLTENNPNSLCIVVSEETGAISLAENGRISKISAPEDLKTILENKLNSEA